MMTAERTVARGDTVISKVLRAFSWLTSWRWSETTVDATEVKQLLPAPPAVPVKAREIPDELLQQLVDRERRRVDSVPLDLQQLAAAHCFQTRYRQQHGPLKIVGFIGAASTGKSTWFNQILGQGRLAIEDPEPHSTQGTLIYIHAEHAKRLGAPDATGLDSGYGLFRFATQLGQKDVAGNLAGAPGRITLLVHHRPEWRDLALADLADTSTSEALNSDATALFLPWLDLALLIDVPDTVQKESTFEWAHRAKALGASALGMLNVWEPDKRLTLQDAERVYRAAGCDNAEILPMIKPSGEHLPLVEKIRKRMFSLLPRDRVAALSSCLHRRAQEFLGELRERESVLRSWGHELQESFRQSRASTLYARPLRPEWLLTPEESHLVRRFGLARFRPTLLIQEGLEWTSKTKLGGALLRGFGLKQQPVSFDDPAASLNALRAEGMLWMEQAEVAVRRAMDRAWDQASSRMLQGKTPRSPALLRPLGEDEKAATVQALQRELEHARQKLLQLVDEVKLREDKEGTWDRTLTFGIVAVSIAADMALPGLGQSGLALLPELLGRLNDPIQSVKMDLQKNLRRPLDEYISRLEAHYDQQVRELIKADPDLLLVLERTVTA